MEVEAFKCAWSIVNESINDHPNYHKTGKIIVKYLKYLLNFKYIRI